MFLSTLFDGSVGSTLALCVGVIVAGLVIYGLIRALGRGHRAADQLGLRPSRLSLVDAFDLDRHRQLVIVRRDNVEHLIMIGGPNDLLIEGGISRSRAAAGDLDPETGSETSENSSVRRVFEPAVQASSLAQNLSFKPSAVSKSVGSERTDEAKEVSSDLRRAPIVAAPMSGLPRRQPSTQLPPRPVLLSRDQDLVSRAAPSRQPEKVRLSMNIDRLEEEMSKLLNQPPDQPKS